MNEAFFKSAGRPMHFGFAVNSLNRLSERREDEAFLSDLRGRSEARALILCRDMPVLKKGPGGLDPLFSLPEIDAIRPPRLIALLGAFPDGAPVYAALLDDSAVELRSDASDGFLDRRVMAVPGRDDLTLVD